MPVNIPQGLQARNVTACSVEFGTPVAGAITFGTPVDIGSLAGTGTFEDFNYEPTKETTNNKAADALVANYQDEFVDFTFTVHEVAPANGVGNLAKGAAGDSHARIILKFKPIGGSTVFCIAGIGLIKTAPKGVKIGKNVDTLTIVPIGIASYVGPFSTLPSIFTT